MESLGIDAAEGSVGHDWCKEEKWASLSGAETAWLLCACVGGRGLTPLACFA